VTKTIIRECLALLPEGDGFKTAEADIVIEDGVIAAIEDAGKAKAGSGDRIIAGAERLVAPGLINAHSHCLSTFSSGAGDRLGHVSLIWKNQADIYNRPQDELYVSALLNGIEMIASGVTAVIDHYPEQNCRTEMVDPVARAYADLGLRATLGLRIWDRTYDDLDPTQIIGDDDELLEALARDNPFRPAPVDEIAAMCEETIAKWHGHRGLISIFPAPSNATRCTDDLLVMSHDIAEKHDLGVHTHLQETKIQRQVSMKYNGKPIVSHMEDLGILSRRWSMAHTVWVDDDEIGLLADRQAVPVHNPESNAKIHVGTSPVPKMLEAGVPVALGADGSSTNGNQNLFDAMTMAVLVPRILGTDKAGWPAAPEALTMATRNGAKAMLKDGEIGALAPGTRADIVLYDLTTPVLAPLNDAAQQLVFSERGQSVRTVIIDGRVVFEDGIYAFGDAAEVGRQAIEMREKQLGRNENLYRITRRLIAAQTEKMT
jgi:cytosine/adenosine deaminase-related metal-dependent hydrolase